MEKFKFLTICILSHINNYCYILHGTKSVQKFKTKSQVPTAVGKQFCDFQIIVLFLNLTTHFYCSAQAVHKYQQFVYITS